MRGITFTFPIYCHCCVPCARQFCFFHCHFETICAVTSFSVTQSVGSLLQSVILLPPVSVSLCSSFSFCLVSSCIRKRSLCHEVIAFANLFFVARPSLTCRHGVV